VSLISSVGRIQQKVNSQTRNHRTSLKASPQKGPLALPWMNLGTVDKNSPNTTDVSSLPHPWNGLQLPSFLVSPKELWVLPAEMLGYGWDRVPSLHRPGSREVCSAALQWWTWLEKVFR